ncbi:MAG: magnesium and cobalt exporter, family [Solirubrobacteraceae bacterium]|nr:magnesium and cobalt exporter, family [Solirubrobacteraceae bacterium]
MIELLLILASLALVAACGAFVAAEFSFITVDRSSVERAAEAGDAKARGVLGALRSLSTQLSAAQLGITVTNLMIGVLAEPAIAGVIDGPLESAGVPGSAVTGVSVTLALVLATGMTMVFGELVPKNLAIAQPMATARSVQAFQRGFTRATGPVVRLFNGTANAVLRRLGIEPQEELASARSAEELASLVRRSAEEGTLAHETAALMQRSLAFGDRRAADVMTPRPRMHALHADAPALAVLQRARETGRSRFPVIVADNDKVVGVVHLKHAMSVAHERRGEVPVREIMAEPLLVPSTIELDPLLEMLRRGGLQMAVVVDEFGTVDGILTLEDLIEEIVGEVRDEHDPREDSARREPDGSWSLSGLLRPDEAGRAVGIAFPEDEDYETLGGLIGMRLGRMPEIGDTVHLRTVDTERRDRAATLTVSELDGLRVDRIRLDHAPADRSGPEETGS